MNNEFLAELLEDPVLAYRDDLDEFKTGFLGVINRHGGTNEICFLLHNVFRNTLLQNPKKYGLSEHEARVGGGKLPDGSRKISKATIPVNEIISYGEWGEDAWAVLLACAHFEFFDPDPLGTTGQTTSIVQNIVAIDENGATAAMATWLPDFEYLEFLEKQNRPKYPDPTNMESVGSAIP